MSLVAAYDAQARALTIDLTDEPIAGTIPFPTDEHLVDVDRDGRPVAFEILTKDLRLAEITERFGLSQRLAEIQSAADAAISGAEGDRGIPIAVTAVSFSKVVVADASVMVRRPPASTRSSSARGSKPQEFDLLPS